MDRNQTVKFKTALRGQKKLLVVATSILALMFSGLAPVQAQTTITVWHYFSGNPSQEKLMADFKEMAEKADTRIKVENVYVPYDQMNSKIVAAAITNSGPDVMVFTGTTTDELVAAGALASMEPYWSTFADKSQFPTAVVDKINGLTYSVQGYVNLLGLWYNQDILDKIKMKPPRSIAQMEKAMAAAVKAGFKGITLCGLPQGQGEWQGMPIISSTGFNYSNLNVNALTRGYNIVKRWVDKGYLSKEATTWDQTVPFQKFLVGDVLFAENGNWQAGAAKTNAKFKYGVTSLPVGARGQVYLGGEAVAIGAFGKNKDLAWSYLSNTYLSKSGQLAAVNVGSIPSRLDSSKNPLITRNALLKPFARTIAKNGASYPPTQVPPLNVSAAQIAGGIAWSSVIGGTDTPKKAAKKYIAKIKALIKG